MLEQVPVTLIGCNEKDFCTKQVHLMTTISGTKQMLCKLILPVFTYLMAMHFLQIHVMKNYSCHSV